VIPEWMAHLVSCACAVPPERFSRFLPPSDGAGRQSAVLMLFGDDLPHGPDVLLIERAVTMRTHGGQPAFPGGAMDDHDQGPTATALREAAEETGLDPAGVVITATLPSLWVPVSNYVVTPVLAYWREPSAITAADPAEVAAVVRVPVADLVNPDNRIMIRHPSGYIGPAFTVGGLTVWGFTGGLLATLMDVAGWSQPWDETRVVPLEERL
jgi:8-oxo-dGTP pyrophosphatase MutT (NUDIX family)